MEGNRGRLSFSAKCKLWRDNYGWYGIYVVDILARVMSSANEINVWVCKKHRLKNVDKVAGSGLVQLSTFAGSVPELYISVLEFYIICFPFFSIIFSNILSKTMHTSNIWRCHSVRWNGRLCRRALSIHYWLSPRLFWSWYVGVCCCAVYFLIPYYWCLGLRWRRYASVLS